MLVLLEKLENVGNVGKEHSVVFNVLQGDCTPILSLESCVNMGFLKILDSDQLHHVHSSTQSPK